MSTHTPTPIKAGKNPWGSTGHVLYDANGQQIADIFEKIAGYTEEQSRELAEQLALRFNSHDALLAACRAIDESQALHDWDELEQQLRAAIKLGKGQG